MGLKIRGYIINFIKSKKGKAFCVLFLLYVVILIFVANDAWLYKTPVAGITKVESNKSTSVTGLRGDKENYYKQEITAKILNGKYKGQTIVLGNEYSYSGVTSQRYEKGNRIFISVTDRGDELTGSIKGQKRDTYLAALLLALFFLLVALTGRKGLRTMATLAVNIGIYVVGFTFYWQGTDILAVCNLMVLAFTITTLLILNGFNKRSFAAIISSLLVLGIIMLLFDLVLNHTKELDYSTMEYLGSVSHPESIFRAEVMLAGLGAIMDVAVTISSSLAEIINKKPDVKFIALFKSGREVGYDIMGTMMNVLLFTFGCGLIPSLLIQMNNGIKFLSIVKLHIPFEISRFLIESIGIVAAIPISIVVSAALLRFVKRRKTA